MRGQDRAPRRLSRLALLGLLALTGSCGGGDAERVDVPGVPGATKTSAEGRAARRAYDGAPPTIPHPPLGARCVACHDERGMSVPEYGFAPAMPHAFTDGLSATSHCTQCHLFQADAELLVASHFTGHRRETTGTRQHASAPPVLPHPVFLRENCLACHAGPAAREELRTTHPERRNCLQCHLEPDPTAAAFRRSG